MCEIFHYNFYIKGEIERIPSFHQRCLHKLSFLCQRKNTNIIRPQNSEWKPKHGPTFQLRLPTDDGFTIVEIC